MVQKKSKKDTEEMLSSLKNVHFILNHLEERNG